DSDEDGALLYTHGARYGGEGGSALEFHGLHQALLADGQLAVGQGLTAGQHDAARNGLRNLGVQAVERRLHGLGAVLAHTTNLVVLLERLLRGKGNQLGRLLLPIAAANDLGLRVERTESRQILVLAINRPLVDGVVDTLRGENRGERSNRKSTRLNS